MQLAFGDDPLNELLPVVAWNKGSGSEGDRMPRAINGEHVMLRKEGGECAMLGELDENFFFT